MIDAHVHLGWYARQKTGLWYYSPRRVIGILNRCGVDAFVISSTTAQAIGTKISDLASEAIEVNRIAGPRARIFYWLSWQHYVHDPSLSILNSGLFHGLKLHEHEGHWIEKNQATLFHVLAKAEELHLPVQFHSDQSRFCSPLTLSGIAAAFPTVRFDFAHCHPIEEMASVISQMPNVWTDTAYMDVSEFRNLMKYNWRDRLMFGSDLPVWQVHEDVALTKRYWSLKKAFEVTGLSKCADMAFQAFVK